MPAYVIYRILGNDLPPRHARGQTLSSLRFILDREPDLPGAQKRWIVNRILDPRVRDRVIGLLEKRGQPYRVIAAEPQAVRDIPRRLERERIAAVIGINQARNYAIEDGRADADWVLPLDGNCFFTPEAWRQIRTACERPADARYAVIPMRRVNDLSALRELAGHPGASGERRLLERSVVAEPQLAFRRDAPDRFDESYPYGHFDKVDLLYRLGVPGPWDDWRGASVQKAKSLESKSPVSGSFLTAGWVWRLPSGNPKAEASSSQRARDRDAAIRLFLDAVDAEGSAWPARWTVRLRTLWAELRSRLS